MADCSFTSPKGWFRYRACAVIINDGHILFAKNEREPYYYSVGGGVHLHETAEEAVVREVFEETGIYYEVDRLLFIHENFFTGSMTNKDQQCHEVALYFLMKPNATKVFNHQSYSLGGIRESVCWLPIAKLDEYEAYPTFFQQELLNLPKTAKHIVTKEFIDSNRIKHKKVKNKYN
ncbi:MAG: NUDIX domain-containing protein [Firmicutes bacterium]|nr:NUDIX domain-containing protein [Bacillota bacterium]